MQFKYKKIQQILLFAFCFFSILSGCKNKNNTVNIEETAEEKSLPVILYHHLDQSGEGASTISIQHFSEHIVALNDAGYTTVSLEQLIDYSEGKGTLPDKPILITFDDGYESVYLNAYPVLQKYNMKATVFVIGVSVGKDTYKDTGYAMLPHFGWETAQEMINSELISIQTHTFDMHQVEMYDGDNCRKGVQRLAEEDDEAYVLALATDLKRAIEDIENNTDSAVTAVAYPFGLTDVLSDNVCSELGIKITFTTVAEGNTVKKGEPKSLYSLNRFSIDDISAQELLELIGGNSNE